MKRILLKTILFGLSIALRVVPRLSREFRDEMRRHDITAQIRLKDRSVGRWYTLTGGRVRSGAGVQDKPDVTMEFKDLRTALVFLMPPTRMSEVVHAAKNFRVVVSGRDDLVVWFMQLLNRFMTFHLKPGTAMPDGTRRFTTCTNGGPLHVFVKDDKIVRTTPIDLTDDDAAAITIHARGRSFTGVRRAQVSPHALALKSMVYSEKRLLYPMKRVDFDVNGERNIDKRGISGYVRISWDEAFDLVAREIQRQKRVHGPATLAITHGSHHQWGNLGYYLSALLRFGNLIGFTRVHPNPDSWEGWFWGAAHHFGNTLRVGVPAGYGTAEDCLKECEMMVFWSSDPESTNGCYAGTEATQRRLWLKELGIEFVHIDVQCTPTAQLLGGRWIPILPGTDAALAAAIMYVWVTEGTYDKEYVAQRTTGFEQWRDYLLGKDDGIPKSPEWQEDETGVPAPVVRALARQWARKKTYLGAGGAGQGLGGACRTATGGQWARSMILMMAMRGWGKPGINFGNMTGGMPLDFSVYFPGYAEGGISGDLTWSASSVNNYLRMPHVLTMNPVKQMIPRQKLPDAIIDGKATGYVWDGSSIEAQFAPYDYPLQGHTRIHALYRYGASSFGTMSNSKRLIEAYRHPSLEFVVCQAIWDEGEARFADVILPACTSLERWDIGEWAGAAGYGHHIQQQMNHRMVVMQHKCIEPLGESKSDYAIFLGILQRMGLGALFTEGCSEFDWCKRIFDSSDLPLHVSWSQFLKKGYHVIPAEPEATRDPCDFRWYAEGRQKDVPEPHPLPSQYAEEYGKGLNTPSGKIEFVATTIARGDPGNPERTPLNRYTPAWEGLTASPDLAERFPLQLTSSHPRYSFHTYGDGKDSTINDIPDHRVKVNGYSYWVVRMNPEDAAARGIGHHQLVRMHNDRGAVILAADVSPLMAPGRVKSYESCAVFEPFDTREELVDRGGCVNLLTPARPMMKNTSAMATNSCLVEVERWNG